MVKTKSTKAKAGAGESLVMPLTRRLKLALYAAWEIEALALKLRDTLSEAEFVELPLANEFIASTLLERLIAVSEALMDVALPGEATVAEMERNLRCPPLARKEAAHG